MEERPVVRGRILQGTSSKRKRRRCKTTRASISGYSSGKLWRNTSSARRLTPTKPEVGSCTSLPRTGRSTRRKKRIPSERTAPVRSLGIRFFRLVLRPVLGKEVHDPTSGFVGVNRRALDVFRQSFPLEYPEIEALVVLQRRRFRFEEVPCKMRPRTTGRSTITALRSLYYVLHVLLGVFVNVLKFDRRYHRAQRERGAGG